MPEERVAALRRLRRGVACLFMAAGPLYYAWILFIAYNVPPALPIHASLIFGYFLAVVLGGMLYLTIGFAWSRQFLYEALSDFLIGVALFVVTAIVPWLAALALAAYGAWRFARIRAA